MEATTITIVPVNDTRWDATINKGRSLTVARGGFPTYAAAAAWVATNLR